MLKCATGRLSMTIFEMFHNTEYSLLKINRNGIEGNKVESILGHRLGVFRAKNSKDIAENIETYTDESILFAKPEDIEPEILGAGIRINGQDYEVVKYSEGKNFDTGEIEHLKLILRQTDYVEY